VEAVFGRDASSVFPNMNKDDDPMEALKASIGAKRFVSETEVCVVGRGATPHGQQCCAAAVMPLVWCALVRKCKARSQQSG
jgi:hypothetical protein